MHTVWKAATTLLVLRYLFFGRSSLAPHSRGRPSPTPSFATRSSPSFTREEELGAYFQGTEEFGISEYADESTDADALPDPDYLTAGAYFNDPLSRSPSPLPSPMHYSEPPLSNIWSTRYEIHDEAFVTLFTALATLHDDVDPVNLRYVLIPIMVLALVSRPYSKERGLCFSLLADFKRFMARSAPGPLDVEFVNMDIPWEKLDAYSEAIEQMRRDSAGPEDVQMAQSAPEWNWWDMMKHIDLDMSCKSSYSSVRDHPYRRRWYRVIPLSNIDKARGHGTVLDGIHSVVFSFISIELDYHDARALREYANEYHRPHNFCNVKSPRRR
jgi:hypothetical protein